MTDTARITVTLTEPVAAGKRLRTDFVQDTYDHIPGTVLRGALAARWVAEHGVPVTTTPEFLDIFEGDGAFGPLHSELSTPVPLSVHLHKYRPEPGRCSTEMWDEATEKVPAACEDCGKPLERSKGTAAGSVGRSIRTRSALTPQGVAREGHLFTQNSVASGARFTGWMQGPALRALHIGGEPVDTLLLGGRTKTQGSALLEVDHSRVPEPVEQHGNEVVLRLLGPGVFVDDFGFPSTKPDHRELSEALGVEVQGITGPTRWCQVEGWHIASGLPKPVERAVQAGSTYRVTCAEPASEQARRALLARGIGLRRREGFGALYTFDPDRITLHGLRERTAALCDAELQEHLPALRRRVQRMQQEPVDDSAFRDRINVGDPFGDALRTLLDIVSPQLFHDVLENCAQPETQEAHR